MNGRKVLKNSLSQLYKNPRHTHLNRSLSSKTILTPSILNKIKMGRTNDPVLIQSTSSVAENHPVQLMTNGNQKSVSSLAAAHLNNDDSPHRNSSPSTSSRTPPSSIMVKDKAILMGNSTA